MQLLSPQELEGIRFTESPRSPLRRSKSRTSTSPLHKTEANIRKRQFVGSLKAVNEHLSKEGLHGSLHNQPLISELQPTTPEAVRQTMITTNNCDKDNDNNEDAALVERFIFPGYNCDCVTPLPHNLDALQHMEMVTTSQESFITKQSFLRYWKEIFFSPPSHGIFVDIFWWFFLNRYRPERHVQDLLFARVSTNYIELLINVSRKKSDGIFQAYPNIIAQCIYSAFMHAFPTSWNSFDEDFKTSLCGLVNQWLLGLKPLPDIWKYWNMEALEPKNLMRHMSTKNDKKTVSSSKKFDLDLLIADTLKDAKSGAAASNGEHLPRIAAKKRQSIIICKDKATKRPPVIGRKAILPQKEMESLTIKGPLFEHAVMDITSNSPLVQYFLKQYGLSYHRSFSLMIKHDSISDQPRQYGDPTYRQIIKHSLDKSQETKDTFERNYKVLKEHMCKHERERTLTRREDTKDLLSLMRHTREVKTLSTFLTVNQLCEQPEKKRKIKANLVIMDAIKRIT